MTWISSLRKHWEKDVLGAGGALVAEGVAKGRAWGCWGHHRTARFPLSGKQGARVLRIQGFFSPRAMGIHTGSGRGRAERRRENSLNMRLGLHRWQGTGLNIRGWGGKTWE